MALTGLDTALSGLRVAQQQLNTIATNVSNVNTPGYTRKILPQETVIAGNTAIGVQNNTLTRKVDLNLSRDFWTQVSSVSALNTKATYLNNIQQFHGPPDLEASIAAKIAALRDNFARLADSPEDLFLQRATVDQAVVVVGKINAFSQLITQMRNDAQDEMTAAVQKVNDTLSQIADLNKKIKSYLISGKSVASLEDNRDELVKTLSNEINVSFFTRGDGVMVVQTHEGVQLVDELAETVYFQKSPLGPSNYYPASANGVYVGGNPATNPVAINITERDIGGRIGALIDLRDTILPKQQALADEMAHKMALRFDLQGLRLFTDADGQIPADTAPDPSTVPPTAVPYVGFSAEIRVNAAVISDNTLVQQGTVATDLPVPEGSNEIIDRVLKFAFGAVEYQQAAGAVDLRASGFPTDMQSWLGIFSQNRITSTSSLTSYSDLNALISAGGEVFDPNPPGPPINDQFTLTFEEARTGLGPTTVTVSLTTAQANFPIGGPITNGLDQLVAEINNQIALAGVPAGLAAQASTNSYGQLVIQSRGAVTIDASFAGGMQQDGLNFLGLTEGAYQTTDPYIDVQVGNDPPVRITIEPGDDETDLVAKLDKIAAADPGVPGLGVDLDGATGFLTLRPGDDVTNPLFGGALKIVGSSFQADGTGLAGGIAAGTGIVDALFGSIQPVTDVYYASATATPGVSVSFRSQNLGPNAGVDTGIISSTTLIDYAQKFINRQVEEINAIDSQMKDETSFRDILQRRMLDDSGVNLDEELSYMIVVQTAFSASARVMTAIDEQFQELLRAV